MEKLLSEKIDLIKNDLKNKNLEELFMINDNIEKYANNYFKKEEKEIENIKKEINEQININQLKNSIIQKQKEIQILIDQKKNLEKQYSKNKIIKQLKDEIEEKYNKPKHQLINDLAKGKINFEEYIQKFKLYGMKYNYYILLIEEVEKKL